MVGDGAWVVVVIAWFRVEAMSLIMVMNGVPRGGGGGGRESLHLRPYRAWQLGWESNSAPEALESARDADSGGEDSIFFDILPISEPFRESSGGCG